MGLMQRLLSPWTIAPKLDAHYSRSQEILAHVLEVTKIQSETNLRLQGFIEGLYGAMVVDEAPEGRPGLSDEEEFEILSTLRRETGGAVKGES